MHRAYQPLLPATNRYLQEKWDKASYQEHRRKVELAAPVVNTTALPTPLHLQVNFKKKQLEKERRAVWDRENLLHSAKLWGIKQSQGRVDNWNFYSIRSLNREKRRRDLAHTWWENQQLLKRLEGRKSELAQEHWQRDWYKEELLRNSIACYPRGTGSCQARKERRRQWTVGSNVPFSAAGDSDSTFPDRTCVPCSSKNHSATSKCSWGSGSEFTPEVTAAPFLTSPVRKRDQAGALARRWSKGAQVAAKVALGALSLKDADGLSVRRRTDGPGGSCLEKPLGEGVMLTEKPPTSLCLTEQLGPCDNSLIHTSPMQNFSGERLRAPKFAGQCILLNILSVKSPQPLPRKSPELPEGTCGRSSSLSPPTEQILPPSVGSNKNSQLRARVCDSSSSTSCSPSDY